MKRYPAAQGNWKEKHMHDACVDFLMDLERLGLLTFYHPSNEGRRSVQHNVSLARKGTKAGQPDLEIFLRGGKTVFVELKTMTGKISENQKRRMEALHLLGFPAYVLLGSTPQHAVGALRKILQENGVGI